MLWCCSSSIRQLLSFIDDWTSHNYAFLTHLIHVSIFAGWSHSFHVLDSLTVCVKTVAPNIWEIPFEVLCVFWRWLRHGWGLNPWFLVYETNALPLGHHALLKGAEKTRKIISTQVQKKFICKYKCSSGWKNCIVLHVLYFTQKIICFIFTSLWKSFLLLKGDSINFNCVYTFVRFLLNWSIWSPLRHGWGLNPWFLVYETNALPLGHHALIKLK